MTVPASALSAVVVESYKKMVLVSLLATPSELAGSKPNLLPKYTSTVVSRHIKQTAQPYHDIATAYQVSESKLLLTAGVPFGAIGYRN